jgi:hypothetical protein
MTRDSKYKNFIAVVRSAFSTYRIMFAAVLVIWVLGFLVGGFASTAVLTENSTLQAYVSAMSFVANPKGLISSKSTFPEITALYYSIVCWSFPFWFSIWWKWMNGQVGVSKTDMIFKAHLSLGNRLVVFLLLPLWIFLTYAFTLNHGGDTRLVAFGTSRLQLATFGMAFPAGMAGTLVLAIFSIKRVFTSEKMGTK